MDTNVIDRINILVNHLKDNLDRIVIDGDTHATDLTTLDGKILEAYNTHINYYHGRPLSAEELISEMKGTGVDMSLIWQNPAALKYGHSQC